MLENDVQPGAFRTIVSEYEAKDKSGKMAVIASLPRLCNHCNNPACIDVCPTGASHQRSNGIVKIDTKECIGCALCVEACPTKALSWDREYAISTWHKADMTHDVLTDEDRAYLKQAMAEAAANPKPPAAPRPKPASAPEKPAETKPTETKSAENIMGKPTTTETTGKEASEKTANEASAPAKPLIEGAASETEVSAHE